MILLINVNIIIDNINMHVLRLYLGKDDFHSDATETTAPNTSVQVKNNYL